MIRIAVPAGDDHPPRVFLGLSHTNLDRLRADQPIRLDVDQCAALGLGQCELVIYSGTDEVAMTAELEKHGLLAEGATDQLRREFAARDQVTRRTGE